MPNSALFAILGMAIVTYGTRVGGFLLLRYGTRRGRAAGWLHHLPGAVLCALVAPAALLRGPADALAAGVALVVAMASRNLLLTIGSGVLAVWLLRGLG